jgi:broad specificity polyphosphatase/5'/3'-nucleotidase SurE
MGLVPAASLQKDKEKKKEVRKETYRKILELVSRKIKNAAEMNQVHIMVTIPPWVLGCPVYDLLLATNYIERQIKNGGYRTARINENSMYVNWDKDRRKSHQEHPETERHVLEEEFKIPSLINLKKVASRYQREK